MNYYPTRRAPKRPPMQAPKPDAPVRCEGHLKWTRGNDCLCAGIDPSGCQGKFHAHHVQSHRATEGGMGMKVGDDKVVCLCAAHHDLVHAKGQAWFEKFFKVNLEIAAANTWRRSPHRIPYERKQASSVSETQAPQERGERASYAGGEDSKRVSASTDSTLEGGTN